MTTLSHLPKRLLACTALVSATCGSVAIAHAEEAGEPVIVVTGANDGYRAITANSTKTPTNLIDVPQSVAVLTRDQLDDQAVQQLSDSLRYVPGVVIAQGEGHRDQIVLRGQSTTADFFLDGLRDDAQYYRPLYNVERVEVLKGANALLFGRGGGGGVINRVSKTPQFDRLRGTATASADTWSAFSLSGDVNAPLSEKVAVRLNGIYEEFDSHRDFYEGRFIGVNPTLAINFSDADRLELSYSRDDDQRLTDRGVPSLNGSPLRGYDRTFFGSTTLNQSTVTADIAHARFDHNFSDTLSMNVLGQYSNVRKYYGNVYPSKAVSGSDVTLAGYNSATDRESWVGQANLVWTGRTGSIGHTVLAGFEAVDQDTEATRADAYFGNSKSATVSLARKLTIPSVSFGTISRHSVSNVRVLSGYLQDQIELLPELQIVAGVRYDDFRIRSVNKIDQFAAERTDRKWSPRLGVIVKPQPNVSFYASYAKSFLPQSGEQFSVLDATTETLAPEQFRNLEAGVKWDIRGDLSLSAAVYQLDRTNSRANDPTTGNAVQTGKSRAKGFEAQLSGRILPAWQLSLGYTYQEGEIRSAIVSSSTVIPAGTHLDKLPKHQVAAWSRYDVTDKLGLGLGITHQSKSFAAISNAVTLPAYTRVDAAIYYDLTDRISLQLNVENLLDTKYYPSAHTDNNITTGEPLNARFTIKAKF